MREHEVSGSRALCFSDFTIKAEAVGVEPVPLWLLLVVQGLPACWRRKLSIEQHRFSEWEKKTNIYWPLDASTCGGMSRTQFSVRPRWPHSISLQWRWRLPLVRGWLLVPGSTDSTGAASSSSVEVSLFLRMSRISSSLPSRAAAEAVEPRPPAIVSATANVGTDPMAATEPPVGADHRSTVSTTRGQDVAAGDNDGDQRPASSVRRGRTRKKAGLSPGRLRRRLSRSVEKQLRRSTEIHRAQSRSLCKLSAVCCLY